MKEKPPLFSAPFKFKPIFKDKVWGGRRLGEFLGKSLPDNLPIGESWEISDHGGDPSVVAEGAFAGRTLRDLIASHPAELLGTGKQPFPLLFKALDAFHTLSVQVHPADQEAAILEPGSFGKTEAWAILHAEPGARIIHGIAPGVSFEDFYRAMEAGPECEPMPSQDAPLSRLFRWREVERGDVVYLPAGTIHAIGSGIVLIEVQQSSDITYRIFDWGRPRPLHLEQARRIPQPEGEAPEAYARWLPADRGKAACWRVVESPFFSMDAVYLPGAGKPLALHALRDGRPRFAVVIGLSGAANLLASGASTRLNTGDFLLIPAALGKIQLQAAGGPFSGLWVQG